MSEPFGAASSVAACSPHARSQLQQPSSWASCSRGHLRRPARRQPLRRSETCARSTALRLPPRTASPTAGRFVRSTGSTRCTAARRSADRDDTPRDAEQLPLRDRHLGPRRHSRLRQPHRQRRPEIFRPEVVTIAAPDGRTEFEYWRIVPAISHDAPAGTGRRCSDTSPRAGGTSTSPTPPRGLRQPVACRRARTYIDSTAAVESLRVERDDHGVSRASLRGRVDLVVEAFDVTPLAVPKPWANRPLMPALVRWRVVGRAGRSVVPWPTAMDFRLPIPRAAPTAVSTRGGRVRTARGATAATGSSSPGAGTPRTLDHGAYEIEVGVADTQGNSSSQRFPVRIAS